VNVEDASHHLIGGQHVVGVEGVNDTLLGLAGYATQHEEAEVVGVDGRGTVNQLTCFIIVIERLPHEVDVVGQVLSRTLHEHEVVQHGERAGK
jgi:hypothetical protein